MYRHVITPLLCAVATAAALAPRAAVAETMLDLYLGGSYTDDSTLRFDTTPPFPDQEVGWDDSFAFGLRAGHWFGGSLRWFGLAGDLSYFRPEAVGGIVELHVVPITPMAMVRIPLLADERFVGGRLTPYAGVGPGLVTSVLTSNAVSGANVGFDVGLDVRAGVTIMLSRVFGLFAEYRYTDVDVKVEDGFGDSIETPLASNHINAGIALRF